MIQRLRLALYLRMLKFGTSPKRSEAFREGFSKGMKK